MLQLDFSTFPVLNSNRLLLRKPVAADKESFFEIRGRRETMQYIPRPLAKSVEDAEAVINMINGFTDRNERINWAIEEVSSRAMIGMIGYVNFRPDSYRGEVGYVLHHQFCGRGYASEALKTVLDYGFNQLGLHSVEAIIRPENERSIKLVEKLGFVREGYFRDYIFHEGSFYDEAIYSLIRDGAKEKI
jgi:[ribosomal protein S5]-alanine N-acetyltransferase